MRQAVIFDFDGTMIPGDSVIRLLIFARKKGVLPLSSLFHAVWNGLLYRLKIKSALSAKRSAHAFLSRMQPSEREQFLRAFARELLSLVFPPALQCFNVHKAQGDFIFLCSASCACYMRPVAELLGADALLCTPSAPDGQALPPNCRGEEKVRRVQEWRAQHSETPLALSAGYGDSGSDAPILRLCKKPVLVNAKRALRRALPQAERVRWRS